MGRRARLEQTPRAPTAWEEGGLGTGLGPSPQSLPVLGSSRMMGTRVTWESRQEGGRQGVGWVLCDRKHRTRLLQVRLASPFRFVTGVRTFGVSGPCWRKKSCLGPHVKYTNAKEN